jgi:hypothetical protein
MIDEHQNPSVAGPLVVRLDGPAVEHHRIALRDLVLLGSQLQTAVDRVARILIGQHESARRGRIPSEIAECCALDLVALEEGSLALVCDLADRAQPTLFEDLGEEALQVLVDGVNALGMENGLPRGFDAGVLLALREGGKLLDRGIDSISFELATRRGKARATYARAVHDCVIARIQRPIANRRIVEGRLLMGDFKETGFRCRLHPAVGKPITCDFGEAQKDAVLSALTKYVRLVGEAREVSGEIASLSIEDIEVLDAVPLGAPGADIAAGFFEATHDLESLAEQQGVEPVAGMGKLIADFWPEEESVDDFLAAVQSWRREDHGA